MTVATQTRTPVEHVLDIIESRGFGVADSAGIASERDDFDISNESVSIGILDIAMRQLSVEERREQPKKHWFRHVPRVLRHATAQPRLWLGSITWNPDRNTLVGEAYGPQGASENGKLVDSGDSLVIIAEILAEVRARVTPTPNTVYHREEKTFRHENIQEVANVV